MKLVLFYHSIQSDWNNGNAHFLRGITADLRRRGHEVIVYEPHGGWSLENLLRTKGSAPLKEFADRFPHLQSKTYKHENLDLDETLDHADLVLVHEWNDPEFIAAIAGHRRLNTGYKLLFHDTHHRSISNPNQIGALDLRDFDGVLAFGELIRRRYLDKEWIQQAWTWHEAADDTVFHPKPTTSITEDLVWVGNWGDEERTRELHEYLIDPSRDLSLKTTVYGVRYPDTALTALREAGIQFGGWLPNYRVPEVFAGAGLTIHVPRRFYAEELHGIPTIRMFEALACGIPLISAPWRDTENLFTEGADYIQVKNGREMRSAIGEILSDPELAKRLSEHGRKTIASKHTCRHRVDELLGIAGEIGCVVSEDTANHEHITAAGGAA